MTPTMSLAVALPSDPDDRLSLVVVGLFALAAVIMVGVILYWWATRPGRGTPKG